MVQVSLAFSLVNFIIIGVSLYSLLLFAVFSFSVYATTRIAVILTNSELQLIPELESLKFHLLLLGVLFIGIATFAYSYLFGIFYATVAIIYAISPYDRDWLLGESKVVVVGNKIEYQKN